MCLMCPFKRKENAEEESIRCSSVIQPWSVTTLGNTYAVSMHIHCMKRDLHLLLLVLTSRWYKREIIKIKSKREKEDLTSKLFVVRLCHTSINNQPNGHYFMTKNGLTLSLLLTPPAYWTPLCHGLACFQPTDQQPCQLFPACPPVEV